jgi:hypothetical protein
MVNKNIYPFLIPGASKIAEVFPGYLLCPIGLSPIQVLTRLNPDPSKIRRSGWYGGSPSIGLSMHLARLFS